MKVWPGITSLNGVRKRRLTAKETSIANCEVLDEKYRIAVQGIFVGIIIKTSGARFVVGLRFLLKINLGNWCPRSLAVCCLLISMHEFSELFRPAVKQHY